MIACQPQNPSEKSQNNEKPNTSELDSLMDPEDFPFYHGVASGDPLTNSVIIWTRVTPKYHELITVKYQISEDPEMQKIIQTGIFKTDSSRDYTVKVDVKNLKPGKYYYYQFHALDKKSPIGRTKTIDENPNKIRLGFASCSNYAWGYFNAYRIMANDTLDAVIHLGDYIYEHQQGVYEDSLLQRDHIPNKEIISLQDYRTRYSQYRLDEDLKAVHAVHPFITIWDDHELANNAYDEGAQNHNEGEGEWKSRLESAKKVYYEWMPIRENDGKHYRSFSFGNLANLIMIDTRTEGRTKQPESIDIDQVDSTMHIINKKQMAWLTNELQSNHHWKVIGNQILFSDVQVFFGKSPQLYNDGWSAYRNDQNLLKAIIEKIKGVILITGDFHSSFAIKEKNYHEYVVPSITSANYDEEIGLDSALIYENWYKAKNPHLDYVNLKDHGYFVLELTEAACFSSFVFSKDIRSINTEVTLGPKFGFRRFAFLD